VFSDDSRVVDEKERDGDEDENDLEDYDRICKSGVRLALLGWKDPVSV